MWKKLNFIWRIVATRLCFIVFGIGGLILPLICAPIILLISDSTKSRQYYSRKLIQKSFLFFVNFMRGIGVLSWGVKGVERLQREGLLILANHPTLIDVVFLISFVPHADCIVKQSLLKNPFMRGFIGLTGFITNDAGSELVDNAESSINRGGALIIFPEGSRSIPGQPLKFKRGAANVALRTNTPITPVHIDCNPITLSKMHRWYHTPTRKFHIQITVGEDISLTPYSDIPIAKAARYLTQDLQNYFSKELQVDGRYDHSHIGSRA
jgi:1-acyl-sn-glycerol-3-phosphate acyltransferase